MMTTNARGAEAQPNLSFSLCSLLATVTGWQTAGQEEAVLSRSSTLAQTCLHMPRDMPAFLTSLICRRGTRRGFLALLLHPKHTYTPIHEQLANCLSSCYGLTDAVCDAMLQCHGHDCWDCWIQIRGSKSGRNVLCISLHNNTYDCLQTGGEGDARRKVVMKDNELVWAWISSYCTASTEGAAYVEAHRLSSLWQAACEGETHSIITLRSNLSSCFW